MKFGMLNFFEHPAGGKTEFQVIEEQLDCMRLAEDLGFDFVWAPRASLYRLWLLQFADAHVGCGGVGYPSASASAQEC